MLSKSFPTTTCQYLVYAMWKNRSLSFNLGEMQTNYCQGFLYYASFVKFVRREKLAKKWQHRMSTFNLTNFKPIDHNRPNLWWLNQTIILYSDTYMNNNRTQTQTWEVREFGTRGLYPDYSNYISIEAKSGKKTYCMLSQCHIFFNKACMNRLCGWPVRALDL